MPSLLTLAALALALPATALADAAETYLASAPPLPVDPCDARQTAHDAYRGALSRVEHQLDEEISRRTATARSEEKAKATEAKAKLQDDMGVPQSARGKKKLSKEERDALASEMMKKQGLNLSMDELQAMKGPGEDKKAQRKALGEKMGAEMVADAQAHPEKHQPRTELAVKAQGLDTLGKGAQERAGRLQAMWEKFRADLAQLEQEAKADEEKNVVPCRKKLVGYDAVASAREMAIAKRLEAELLAAEKAHCARFGKRQVTLLSDFKAKLGGALGDYRQYDEDEVRLAKLSTGVDAGAAHPGVRGLKAVQDYLGHAREPYRYAPQPR